MMGGYGLRRLEVYHLFFSAHFLTGALKSYLRELPEPLMTFELYNEWLEAAG